MHEKCKNNIHRVTEAKWLEYCAPTRVLQVRSTRQANSHSVHIVKLGASQTLYI
jgi:hypothetical protein